MQGSRERGDPPRTRKSGEMKYLLGWKAWTRDRAGAPKERSSAFPVAALVAGVVASIMLFLIVKDNTENEAKLRFERQASDAQHVIEARAKSYFDVLYGLGALFSTSNTISRAEFHNYVAALDLAHRYPGF